MLLAYMGDPEEELHLRKEIMGLISNILGLEFYLTHSNFEFELIGYVGLKGEIWTRISGVLYLYSLNQWKYMRFPKDKCYSEKR